MADCEPLLLQDLVEELTKPQWWVDRKGEIPPGKKEYFQLPIFHYYKVGLPPTMVHLYWFLPVFPYSFASFSPDQLAACPSLHVCAWVPLHTQFYPARSFEAALYFQARMLLHNHSAPVPWLKQSITLRT